MKEFLLNVRRVLYWLPIIWSDRWWDGAFLLRIMEAKLRWDAKHYQDHGISSCADRHAKKMLIAAALCKRLQENDYTTPWDAEAVQSTNLLWDYMDSNKQEHAGWTRYSSEGYKADKVLERAAGWARECREEMEEQDVQLLCELLRRNIRGWWD